MFRSKSDAIFGGVCGGLANAVNMPPWGMRCIAVVLFMAFHALTVIGYCVLWACIPREP